MMMRGVAGVLAIVLIVAACANGETVDGQPTSTSTDTSMPTSQVSTTSTASTSTTAAATTTALAATTTSSPPDVAAAAPFDTWITVLASLPTGDYDAAAAQQVAAASDNAAQLLLSDDYATLDPGFWVVYLGGYDFEWEAEEACPPAIEDCYARYLAAIESDATVGVGVNTALAVTDVGTLVVFSTVTGEVLRTQDPGFGGDGASPGSLTLGGDGSVLYYSVGFEDYWFSCEASDGTLLQLELATEQSDKIADGFSPDVSADGRYLLYLASSECFPDPAETQFVLAPIDTIVRRDLTTGQEERVTVPLDGDVAAGYEFWSAAWGPDDEVYVLDTSGALWRYPLAGTTTPWLEPGAVVTDLGDDSFHELIGYEGTTDLLLYVDREWTDDVVTTQLYGIDLDAGDAFPLLTTPGNAAFALDRSGEHLLIADEQHIDAGAGQVPTDLTIAHLAW